MEFIYFLSGALSLVFAILVSITCIKIINYIKTSQYEKGYLKHIHLAGFYEEQKNVELAILEYKHAKYYLISVNPMPLDRTHRAAIELCDQRIASLSLPKKNMGFKT